MIRVAVVDDHHLVRQGIVTVLDRDKQILLVGEAADGQAAVELAQSSRPDVLVMDIGMPRLNGLQALEQIAKLDLPTAVLILTMYAERTLAHQALHLGAAGYVLKTAVAEELVAAIRTVHRGEVYLSPALRGAVLLDFLYCTDQDDAPACQRLTPRERQVLQLIAEGHTNQSIAHLLQVKTRTVQRHRSSLMTKLDVHDVPALVRLAYKHDLVSHD
jgi:DNA-binding NarL/FixJ family response regulator